MKDGAQIYYGLQALRKTDAFHEWSEYRQELTQLVLENCERGQRLAIMGAGCCNDIDLQKLSGHFSEITLVDFNESAMKRGQERYHLEHDKKIRLKTADFVGLKPEDYIHFADTVLQALEEEPASEQPERDRRILDELNAMYAKISQYQVDLGMDSYDCSLVLGVHSQLNDMAAWIWSRCQQQTENHVENMQDVIGKRINAETEAIVHRFNDAVCRATRDTMITGYETGILGRCQGVQGAVQAGYDFKIREINGELKLTQEKSLAWPYDTAGHIVFTMSVCTFQMLK